MNELITQEQTQQLPVKHESKAIEIAQARHAQEVQAAMIAARQWPRDQFAAAARIMHACQRVGLAEVAMYAYPRGGQTVTGPSIRLAEVLAQNWCNIDYGVMEISQRDGESDMLAFAWDLETNVRCQKLFTVKHQRFSRKGLTDLEDPRDIYEMTANLGSRRLRACILSVIPKDVQDDAVRECEKTLSGQGGKSLKERLKGMVKVFDEHGVSVEMIERRLGHKLEATNETELVSLRKIYTSIKDGMSARDEWFQVKFADEMEVEESKELHKWWNEYTAALHKAKTADDAKDPSRNSCPWPCP